MFKKGPSSVWNGQIILIWNEYSINVHIKKVQVKSSIGTKISTDDLQRFLPKISEDFNGQSLKISTDTFFSIWKIL